MLSAKWLPRDFVESSSLGGLYTVITYAVMVVVAICEVRSFLSSSFSTLLSLDLHEGALLQINFDVDVYDIECRNLRILVHAQGDDEQAMPLDMVRHDFTMRALDSKGRTFGMAFRPSDLEEQANKEAAEMTEEQHQKQMQELKTQDGAKELDADWSSSHDGFKHKSFDHVIQAHDFAFIMFFADWCPHCRKFSPKWDQLEAKLNGKGDGEATRFPDRDGKSREVRLFKMNCVDFKQVCHDKGIDAYPSLRLYKADGSFSVYEGKRDDTEITRWIERTVKMKSYGWAKHHEAFERGCNAKGYLQVPRVPGFFELLAGGGDQSLNPSLTNVSHYIKHLSFSDADDGKYHRKSWTGLPHDMLSYVSPLDGKTYITDRFHQTWAHEMQVVSAIGFRGATAYLFQTLDRLSQVPDTEIPQARFHFEIEPFSIRVMKDAKRWYDFVTSLLAILGGTFVVGRITATLSLSTASAIEKNISPTRRRHAGDLDASLD
eukprot:gnl/TRDRNA2_/TRDRNA2_198738_c0_seq1.p1 gnl/TRDRNA2_/TRDRNA2_198738_c0~~gnl/TRDRNA2_/TRDRNA2_198738_c0_seq1.p1  ORF type:complete len:503 (+),score=96.66 gnl/TRDRNA2_/TRDRNA2_198738_c0_seq1:43-1509(+)